MAVNGMLTEVYAVEPALGEIEWPHGGAEPCHIANSVVVVEFNCACSGRAPGCRFGRSIGAV